MSNSNLFQLASFPKAVLGNGLGRYICQLQRITIKFCKSHGSSRGIREFIENDLIDFAKVNPNVVVYVKPRRHRSPVFVAEYLNGERKWMNISNFSREEVNNWLNLLKSQSGIPVRRLMRHWHTENPSIQGPWSPFLFRNPELNTATFPDEKWSHPINLTPSATEIILEIARQQKVLEDGEVLPSPSSSDDETTKAEVKV